MKALLISMLLTVLFVFTCNPSMIESIVGGALIGAGVSLISIALEA